VGWPAFDGLARECQDILKVLALQVAYTPSIETIGAMLGEPGPLRHHEQTLLRKGTDHHQRTWPPSHGAWRRAGHGNTGMKRHRIRRVDGRVTPKCSRWLLPYLRPRGRLSLVRSQYRPLIQAEVESPIRKQHLAECRIRARSCLVAPVSGGRPRRRLVYIEGLTTAPASRATPRRSSALAVLAREGTGQNRQRA
jgi:hypothetical protein